MAQSTEAKPNGSKRCFAWMIWVICFAPCFPWTVEVCVFIESHQIHGSQFIPYPENPMNLN